jgi:adenine-specific DNA-methyltransferase
MTSDKQGKATGEIQAIFGEKIFNYPKPSSLLRSLVSAVAGPGELVLDFFAGSATTAQAVMELNAEDEGGRRFILVSSTEATTDEPDKNICRNITAERIRRLNGSAESVYASLCAEFAYLRVRRVQFEDLNYELNGDEVWTALEAMHDLPLTLFKKGAPFQVHETNALALFYIDKFSLEVIDRLKALGSARRNVLVYAWAPGQVTPHLADMDIEVTSVRDVLVKRFQQ